MARGIFFDGSQDHLDCGQERAALDCDENELFIDGRSLVGGDPFEEEADGGARNAGVHLAVVTGRVRGGSLRTARVVWRRETDDSGRLGASFRTGTTLRTPSC